MRYHFMHQYEPNTLNSMEQNAPIFDDVGYYSVLYPFATFTADNWIKIARSLNTGHTFKYMVALRPYHISSDYCAMMIEAFNQIQPDRLILNFLSGQDTPGQEDNNNYLNNRTILQDKQERREFIRKYVNDLSTHPLITRLPKFVISGYSEYAINTAEIFNATVLSMLEEYHSLKDRYTTSSNKMVALNLLIRNTEEEANAVLEDMIKSWVNKGYSLEEQKMIIETEKKNTLLGTKEQVKQQILSLAAEGITDILITIFNLDSKNVMVYHNLIKEIIKESVKWKA